MKNFKPTRTAAMLIVLFSIVGCRHDRVSTTREPYYGITEPMPAVIDAINRNNRQITSLWADPYFEATIVDDKHN